MDMGDGRVDDGRFGWASDLGEVGKESCEVEESTIESLSTLTFNGVVGSSAFSGVGAPAGFALHLTLFLRLVSGGKRGHRSTWDGIVVVCDELLVVGREGGKGRRV
jgi:hypothetical protein